MKKRLMLVMGLAVAALGIGATAAVLGTTPAVFTRADVNETRTVVLTAADFSNGNGDFSKAGLSFHYANFSVEGNTATIGTNGEIYMTMSHYSGESLTPGGRRGNGFTQLSFAGFDQQGSGSLVFGKRGTDDDVAARYNLTSSVVDLLHDEHDDEVTSANRRRIHVLAGAATISFTSMTFTYECVNATPTITINGDTSVNKDSNITLTAETQDIADTATYTWTSDDTDVATIVGNGKTATVTGVAGGDATITVQAIVGGDVVDSDTYAITVIEEAATYYKVEVLSSTYWEGSGVFYHINPSSVGKTSAQLGALTFSYEMTSLTGSAVSFTMNNSHSYGHGGVNHDDDTVVYMNATGAPSNADKFALRFEFKDAANNVIYYSTARFQGGSLLPDVQITAAENTVNEGGDLALTAIINDESFTPVSCVWDTSDHSKATVVGNNLSATVSGVDAGAVNVTLTVTDSSSNVLVGTFALTVLDPGAAINALPVKSTSYVDGAQIFVYLDNTDLGITSENAGSISKTISITASSEKSAAQPYVTGGTNPLTYSNSNFQGFSASDVTLYITTNIGVPNDWDMTIVVDIKLTINTEQYQAAVTFFNGAYLHA